MSSERYGNTAPGELRFALYEVQIQVFRGEIRYTRASLGSVLARELPDHAHERNLASPHRAKAGL